jgi:putative spermidine/putrescine transport system permease protein
MLVYSFQTYDFYSVGLPWTTQNYVDLVTAGNYAKLFVKTLVIAVIVTLGALVIGSPFAYYISRVAGRRLAVFLLLVTVLPLWMNVVIRNYSWIALITNNGVLNTALEAIGLPKLDIIYTLNIVIVVGITLALPFAVLVLYATMGNISNEVEEASLDLGSNRLFTFMKVIFPLSASGYQTAALLIFMPTLAFYVTPIMLGGTEGAMVATALMPVVRDVLDFAQGGAYIVPIVAMLMLMVFLLRRGINIDNLYRSGVGSNIARHTQRRSIWLLAYVIVILAISYLPLFSMVLFSFGKNSSAVFPMQGGTLQWYRDLFSNGSMLLALKFSIIVAIETAIVSLMLCAPAAYAVVRHRFPGRGAYLFISLLPMLIPEIILGLAILVLLITTGVPLSLQTVVLGHVTLALPFVFLTILAQQYGFDRSIEEASKDLGATPLMTFIKVVLPLMVPALIAGAFLAITISFNDFVVAFILTSGESTLPLYIFGLQKAGTSPSSNALGTLIIVGVVLVLLIVLIRPWDMVIRRVNKARATFGS